MKFLKSSILMLLCVFIVSCDSKKENLEPIIDIPCGEDCLFTMKKASGKMIYMECFGTYGIKSQSPEDETITIWGIPNAVDDEFKEPGKEVTFSATFKLNTLEPQFPDPLIDMGRIYQIDLVTLASKN